MGITIIAEHCYFVCTPLVVWNEAADPKSQLTQLQQSAFWGEPPYIPVKRRIIGNQLQFSIPLRKSAEQGELRPKTLSERYTHGTQVQDVPLIITLLYHSSCRFQNYAWPSSSLPTLPETETTTITRTRGAQATLPFLLSDRKSAMERAQAFREASILPKRLRESNIAAWIENPQWLKTHDWRLLGGLAGKYMIVDFLGSRQYHHIAAFLSTCSRLWAKQMTRDEIASIQADIRIQLAELEHWLPTAELGILRHLLVHVADYISIGGPPWTSAMWTYERLWGRLCRWMHQNTHPATSMMNSYFAFKVAVMR